MGKMPLQTVYWLYCSSFSSPDSPGRVIRNVSYKHMLHEDGSSFRPCLGLGDSGSRNSPSRCALREESHSVPRGENCSLNFKGGCPRGPTRLTPQKCLMNYHGRHQLCRLMAKRSLVYVSVEEDKFSPGFENLKNWATQLTTAPLPSFTMLYHGSFTFYIPFQQVFINLSETDSMSVLCFFCNTMATKWLEIVFGLVLLVENHWGLLWNSFSTHNSTRHWTSIFPTLDDAVKKHWYQILKVCQGQTPILCVLACVHGHMNVCMWVCLCVLNNLKSLPRSSKVLTKILAQESRLLRSFFPVFAYFSNTTRFCAFTPC